MNYKMVFGTLGRVMLIMVACLCVPLIVGIYFGENLYLAFLVPAGVLLVIGTGLTVGLKKADKTLYAKEGFVIVAFSWVLMSVVGALPFVISGEIPNFVDALFESVSGFTTTGATALFDVEKLSKGMQFWRIFTHFIGGMGVLVLLLAITPSGEGLMHIYRAESPGPSSSKFVSKMKFNARILYAIYIGLTVMEAVLLIAGGTGFYDGILTAFSTAGTGGFSMYNDSIAHFNSTYIEVVVSTFMFLFGVNFNVFYLLLIKSFKKAFSCEEVWTYCIILIVSIVVIVINLMSLSYSFGDALRYAYFQTTAISSTTGFTSTEFGKWPALSKSVLMFLMIVGACGGSTGGGVKVSRFMILFKSGRNDIKKLLHPRSVSTLKLEGETVEKEVEKNVFTYLIVWIFLVVFSTVIISFSPEPNDLLTNFTASMSCVGNVGPVLNATGASFSYGVYAPFAKIILCFLMLAGRLEIFPIIILLSPNTWKK